MKLYYDAAYGLLFICAGLGIGYFDAYGKSLIYDVISMIFIKHVEYYLVRNVVNVKSILFLFRMRCR